MNQIENFLSNVEEYFESKGIVALDKENNRLNIDADYLSIPSNISDLSPSELGEYLNAFTQQRIYARTLQTRLEIQEELAKRRYNEAFDEEYIKLTNGAKKYSEAAKEKLVNMHQDVRPLYYEYCDWQKKRSYLENYIKSLEEGTFLFSREITRRGLDFNYERRNF